MAAVHFVATPKRGFRILEPKSARWLWEHLRRAFPRALACCLMPDHLHLLLPTGADENKLRCILAQHGRLFGTRWSIHVQPATTSKIVWRAIGYVVCNPIRSHLVDDPWIWPWSTLRDLGGVIVQPWTIDSVRSVARVLRIPRARVLPRLSEKKGQAAPSPAAVDDPPLVTSLSAIAAAVASSLRQEPEDIRRRGRARLLFVHLASSCGSIPKPMLAEACDVSVRAVYKMLDQNPPPGMRSASRCLRDPRLRIWDVSQGWDVGEIIRSRGATEFVSH